MENSNYNHTISPPSSKNKSLALLIHNRPGVLHKVIYEDWPRSFLIIIPKIIIHCGGKVKEKVPGVLGD